MTQLIKEAIADANAVQHVAEERAKSMLIKEFAPKIKSALASLINEEVSTGDDQPTGYNPEEDKDAIGASVPPGQSAEDPSKQGDGPKIQEEDDLEVDDDEDELIKEEDDEEGEEEDELIKEKDNEEIPSDDDEEIIEIDDEDIDNDEEEIEEVEPIDKGDEEEDDVLEIVNDEEDGDEEKDDDVILESLKKKNKALKRENKHLRESVAILHNKFKKIDLFNAKLAYAFKLMTQPGLNRSQKRQIAETFDTAKSVREAQLIYKTFKSGITPTGKKPLVNKNVKSVISEKTKQPESLNRLNELAGL